MMKKLPVLLGWGAAVLVAPAAVTAQDFHHASLSGGAAGRVELVQHHHGRHHGHGWGGPRLSFGFGFFPSFPVYAEPPPYFVERRYAGTLETDVQRELARRGYYNGAIDGVIGPRTQAAIGAYQRDHGLAVTGRIDSVLLRALGLS